MSESIEPVPAALLICGAPQALRDGDDSLVPEDHNGLPCSGGFQPDLGCAKCAFARLADATFDAHWNEAQQDSDFQWWNDHPANQGLGEPQS